MQCANFAASGIEDQIGTPRDAAVAGALNHRIEGRAGGAAQELRSRGVTDYPVIHRYTLNYFFLFLVKIWSK